MKFPLGYSRRAYTLRPWLITLLLAAPSLGAVAAGDAHVAVDVESLIAGALDLNPEIRAARAEADAAAQRVAPSGSLEDPVLEAGMVNAPLPFSLRRDDMTMKMLGLTQKLPYPGKRALRAAVASADAVASAFARDEVIGRVLRDVRVSYEEYVLSERSARIAAHTRETLRELATLAATRYAVGRATQVEVLQSEMQITRIDDRLLALGEQKSARASELRRLVGGEMPVEPLVPAGPSLRVLAADRSTLAQRADSGRPELKALRAMTDRGDREVELAHREYFPDFEFRLGYGQRDRSPDGMRRDDMITATVAINLPIWRQGRLAPRLAEARSMRSRAAALADVERDQTLALLDQQLTRAGRASASADLYRTTLLPQAHAATQSARSAYDVGRGDLLAVLNAELAVHEVETSAAEAVAAHNEAVAEIEFLTGLRPDVDKAIGGEP